MYRIPEIFVKKYAKLTPDILSDFESAMNAVDAFYVFTNK